MDTTRLEQLISDVEHLDMGDMAADGVTVFMVWQKEMLEAVAALQPGGARPQSDREIMAQWCDGQAAGWGDDPNADFIRAIAKELRAAPAPVAVDDAMVERFKKAKIPGGSEAHWWFLPASATHDPKAVANVDDVIRRGLEAALQAGRK